MNSECILFFGMVTTFYWRNDACVVANFNLLNQLTFIPYFRFFLSLSPFLYFFVLFRYLMWLSWFIGYYCINIQIYIPKASTRFEPTIATIGHRYERIWSTSTAATSIVDILMSLHHPMGFVSWTANKKNAKYINNKVLHTNIQHTHTHTHTHAHI